MNKPETLPAAFHWLIPLMLTAHHLMRFMRRDDPPTHSATLWQMNLHLVGFLRRL